MPMLQLDNVVAGYVPGVDILRGVSLHVEPGEIVCLVGPNGAGKSTVLRTVSGFLKPSSGSIKFINKSIAGLAPEQILKKLTRTIFPQARCRNPAYFQEEHSFLKIPIPGEMKMGGVRQR